MQRRTPIFIICSVRPRTGKTLMARVLIEFFRSQERAVAAFDVNPDEFNLVDYLPGHTAVASIEDTRGEIALFDGLLTGDGVPKVVDLGHRQFDKFCGVIGDIGFAEEAARRGVVPHVLFIPDRDRRSRQGYEMLRGRFPALPIAAVFNEANRDVAQYRGDFPATPRGGPPLTMPAISPVVRGVIERPSFSFAALAVTATDTSSELYGWTRRLFIEFRELELRLMLADMQPALRFSA